MTHIVLLGDSIFDNAPYVPAGMAVADHLRACLAPHDRVTLQARDGSATFAPPTAACWTPCWRPACRWRSAPSTRRCPA